MDSLFSEANPVPEPKDAATFPALVPHLHDEPPSSGGLKDGVADPDTHDERHTDPCRRRGEWNLELSAKRSNGEGEEEGNGDFWRHERNRLSHLLSLQLLHVGVVGPDFLALISDPLRKEFSGSGRQGHLEGD